MASVNFQEIERLEAEQTAYNRIEKDFEEVINELASDPGLERFRQEYEKLFRSLRRAHENEKKLLSKCKELMIDIDENTKEVQKVLLMTQEDAQTITQLRGELERTYKILELAKEREEKSKNKIENLNTEMKHLQTLIQEGSSLSSGQTNTVHELIIEKEELEKGILMNLIIRKNNAYHSNHFKLE